MQRPETQRPSHRNTMDRRNQIGCRNSAKFETKKTNFQILLHELVLERKFERATCQLANGGGEAHTRSIDSRMA